MVGKPGKRMSNSLAHHHILWRNHWEIAIMYGLKWLKYHTGIKHHYRWTGGKWQLNDVRKGYSRNDGGIKHICQGCRKRDHERGETETQAWMLIVSALESLALSSAGAVWKGSLVTRPGSLYYNIWGVCMYCAGKRLKADEMLSSEVGSAELGHQPTLAENSPADANWWDTGFCCCRATHWKASEEESAGAICIKKIGSELLCICRGKWNSCVRHSYSSSSCL